MLHRNTPATLALLATLLAPIHPHTSLAQDRPPPPITFNQNFEGASLGTIEKLDDSTFRCHVAGQCDERGRNRQASWYYFRMDHVQGRDVTLALTDFVGEYNDKPGACPMGPDLRPVFSYDGRQWQHFDAMDWDDAKKDATIRFTASAPSIFIAHVPPYTPSDLRALLVDTLKSPHALVEVIGKSVQCRDIPLVTVTDPTVADDHKKTVWLQARQHAWEAGTSYVMDGAIRFIISDEPRAKALRSKVVFKFTPMVDLDGCAAGKVRFNANNYDVNRHWDAVDLRQPEFLRLMPEIWYTKKAILAVAGKDGRGIDLMLNLHNNETTEYLSTAADDVATLTLMRRFEAILLRQSSFDPSRPLAVSKTPADTTSSLFTQHKVPVMLMEQRIGPGKKLGGLPKVADRLKFGRDLVTAMAEAVVPQD